MSKVRRYSKEKKEKIEKFAPSLSLIQDKEIMDLTKFAISKIHDEFFREGASSTGKYHPPYAQGEGGLLRHTIAAVYFAKTLFTAPQFAHAFSQRDKDIIIASIILHDSCKRGVNFEDENTKHEHPLLVRQLIDPSELEGSEIYIWEEICLNISTHMGTWVTSKYSDIVLPAPNSFIQYFISTCDYLASRKEVDVKIFDEMGVEIVPEPTASDKQVDYIKNLVEEYKGLRLDAYNGEYDSYAELRHGTSMLSKAAGAVINKLRGEIAKLRNPNQEVCVNEVNN